MTSFPSAPLSTNDQLSPIRSSRPATVADAVAVTRTAYTPYGQLRGADNVAVDRGWLGQVEDRVDGATGTGLTYLNARYYDPVSMRFISPDPLMNPADPTTLDPYRYADNNPVVFIDITGLSPGPVCVPVGPRGYCMTFGQTMSGDPQTQGTIDGGVDWAAQTGYAVSPDGLSDQWGQYQARVHTSGVVNATAQTFVGDPVDSALGMATYHSRCASSALCAGSLGTRQGQYDFSYKTTQIGLTAGSAGALATVAPMMAEVPTQIAGLLKGSSRATGASPSSLQRFESLKASLKDANYPATSIKNVTTPGSSPANFAVGLSFRDLAKNLKAAGFRATDLGKGKVQYAMGQRKYTYYPNAKSGGPTVQVSIDGVVRAKLRLKAV